MTDADIQSGAWWLNGANEKQDALEAYHKWVDSGRPAFVPEPPSWENTEPVRSVPVEEYLPDRVKRLREQERERQETARTVPQPAGATETPVTPSKATLPIGPVDIGGGKYLSERQASAFSEKYSMPNHNPNRRSRTPAARHDRYMKNLAEKNGTTARIEERAFQRRNAARTPKETP